MNTRAKIVTAVVMTTLSLAGLAMGQNAPAVDRATPQAPAALPSGATPIQPATNAPITAKPQLVFEELDHDFGRIPDTKQVEAQFKFTNKGDGALKFTTPFHATCGCTAGMPRSDKSPDKDQTEFGPGESGFIKVTYNPSGKHGDIEQRVTVVSNDPQQPEQILKIHAKIRQTIAFDPPLVSFGNVRVGETKTIPVKVTGPAPDFKVNYASISKGRYITVKVLDTKPAKIDGEDVNQTMMELTFNGNAPRGLLQAITTVRTSNEQYPLSDLQVTAEVVGDLEVLPPRVNVGIIEAGQSFSKTFQVSSRTNKPFKITGKNVKTQLATPLEVNITPADGSESAYRIEVKGQGPTTPTPISATITLSTDAESDKTIEVMLNGAVRPPSAPAPALQPDGAPAGPAAMPPAKPAPASPAGGGH